MKTFQKTLGDVGMAVPQSAQTRCMDGSVQATQRTTQVTPSLHLSFCITKLCYEMTGNSFVHADDKNEGCRDGVTCVVLCVVYM